MGLTSLLNFDRWVEIRQVVWESFPHREHTLGTGLALTRTKRCCVTGAGKGGMGLGVRTRGTWALAPESSHRNSIVSHSLLSSEIRWEREH